MNVHISPTNFYDFDGPHSNTGKIADTSGVYVITTHIGDSQHRVIDVGESAQLKKRIENHDRSSLWPTHALGGLFASVFYCEEATRMLIESQIRQFHSPPCGIQ